MADMYGSSNVHSPTPSSSSASLPLESEDLSTFLQQFLHPSSASSSFIPHSGQLASSVSLGLRNERDGVVSLGPSTYVASSSEINFAEAGVKFNDWTRNGVGFGFGDQVDEIEFTFDTENDGGSASELGNNPAKSRSSSKRSRAAAVHNLSEKRRRSRINEKLKALQKLIPNSNKSDKASMLDEAIEYLKQLQLQVQMLSMKNGVSLHPLCMPGVAQPLHLSHEGTSYGMGKDMLPITSSLGTFPSDQDASNQTSVEISNHGNSSNLPKPALNNIPNSEIAFCLDQTLVAHYNSFDLSSQSKNEGTRLLDAKKR